MTKSEKEGRAGRGRGEGRDLFGKGALGRPTAVLAIILSLDSMLQCFLSIKYFAKILT